MKKGTSNLAKGISVTSPAKVATAVTVPAVSAPKGTPQEELASSEPLMLEDHRLMRGYSVMEIATLAAGCSGDTPIEQMHKAINLLSVVERFAATHPGRRFKYMEICNAAERDGETDGIKRSSLIREICKAAGRMYTAEYALRKFNEWVKDEWSTYERSADDLGLKKLSFKEYQALTESGGKEILINDPEAALSIAETFSCWLEFSQMREYTKPVHSRKKDNMGQIVSPKSHGASRNPSGKFAPPK